MLSGYSFSVDQAVHLIAGLLCNQISGKAEQIVYRLLASAHFNQIVISNFYRADVEQTKLQPKVQLMRYSHHMLNSSFELKLFNNYYMFSVVN